MDSSLPPPPLDFVSSGIASYFQVFQAGTRHETPSSRCSLTACRRSAGLHPAPRRHRVDSPRVERMAPRQTPRREPAAPGGAEPSDRFARIDRTSGMKPASRWEQWRDPLFVGVQDRDQEALHCRKTLLTSRRNSSNGAAAAARLGLNTTSHRRSSLSISWRTASRRRRLIRFRMTALPSARGVVRPIRGPSGSLRERQNARK